MPPGQTCPDASVLAAFVRGRVTTPERRALEEHLDGCHACRRAAVGMLSQVAPPAGGPVLPPTAGELSQGDKVGRHIVIGRLGSGGMGTVYAAYDTALERKIALKFMFPTTPTGPDGARLLEEASAMARLAHPNVVTVHDVGMWNGKPYLAMEYVNAQTLDEWRQQPAGAPPRRPREILEVMAAVARGLEAAHAAGIVHRDVKPHNVLVADGRVLVTDFGLSVRAADADAAARVAGTPLYMAPEQLGGGPATPATDVFAFCVTLYEMLYGQHPFGGGDDLRARVLGGQVRPPPVGRGALRHVPKHVRRLLLAGLAVDPATRPASMGAIAAALLDDPARRRRRVGALVVAAGAVAGAFWVGGYLKADPGRRCQAGAAVMDGAWNPQRRQQLASGHGDGPAAAAWQLVARRFDDYAGAWRDMFADTCRAAFSDRRISGELFDLRMNCLDGHRASFAAVVGSVAGANVGQLQKLAAAALPPIAECGINERLSAKPLPADPTSRAHIARINGMLAQVDAARALGDFARARKLATEAVSAARQLGYQPLEARAINQLAAVELRGMKLAGGAPGTPASQASDRALGLLEQSIAVAEAGRDDASRADAATQLVLAHRDAGRLAEAERWAELASAIVARLGDPPLYRSAVDYARGWIQYDRREWDAAEASFARSLRLRQQLLGPRAPEVLSSKTSGCHVMVRAQRLACYREAITLALSIAGPRHPDLANIKANLAMALLDDALTRAEACKLAAEAVDIERTTVEPNHIGLLGAMMTLAQCTRNDGRVEEARRIYLEAIGFATHPTGVRGDLLQDYGVFLMMQEDYPQAISYLRKAVADRELVYGPTHMMPIETRYRVADSYRRMNKPLEALKEVQLAIDICEKAGATPVAYPDLYELKGSTLMGMGKLDLAYQSLLRALQLHEQIKTPEGSRYNTLETLGKVEARLGKLDEAIAHLEKAMTLQTLESAPIYHAGTALTAADAVARKGRAFWPRACELARRALTGYSQPFGGSVAAEIAQTRKFMAAHRCGGNS
jgi:eukaryotic-like serine/threonine-protein kinase